MASVIELRHIDKTYVSGDIRTQVLFDINLAIEEGSFNSIIGQSGSGKTTLMNILGTLDRPSRGEVLIDGRNTATMKKNDISRLRNQTIGFVFQFHYLLPEFTAMENVLMPYWIESTRPSAEVRARAEKLIEMVGLGKVKNNMATKMSGGQQQRTAIARALTNKPKIILADEQTGNLDSDTSDTVFRLLHDINRKLGTTFVIVTHNRKIAEETDRIIEIKDGKIFADIKR